MTFDITSAQLFLFVDICLLLGVAGMYYTFLKHERKKMNDVIKTNATLAKSVNSLVKTMNNALEQNMIDKAVSERVQSMEDITIG